MSENIAVIGAGICGLCSALALSRKGNQVTLYERDVPPPEGGANEAFFEWKRRGAAQFRHPHAFLGLMCNILQDNYPDLVEEFWQAGARKVTFAEMVPPELNDQYQPQPEDDKLWMLMCRRATIETVLRRYVMRQPNIKINDQANVVSAKFSDVGGKPAITGIEVVQDGERRVVNTDVVIDAGGRTSQFRHWFKDIGLTVREEDDDAEIVYYTRHYKLLPGVQEPSRHERDRSAGDLGYMKYGVFPGDDGQFAVIICVPDGETELREAIKSGETYDEICRAIPGINNWMAVDKAEATTASFGFADIHAVWRHYVEDGEPLVLNYFAVGDAQVRTNPLYGRGCSTGTLHAHLLADVFSRTSDARERAILFDQHTEDEMRPIFKTSLAEDKRGIKRASALLDGQTLEQATTFKKYLALAFGDAIAAASRAELHVFRGVMKTFNLLEKPGEFLNNWRIRLTIMRYMFRGRKRNAPTRLQSGPSRDEMITLLSQPQSPSEQAA
ncbi:MAG: 2-polyprenyl-6-methoxyphenol hydroxylase-like FAD-dependent oxidoreductase [Candidatus Azotimanducaceae bacterium]